MMASNEKGADLGPFRCNVRSPDFLRLEFGRLGNLAFKDDLCNTRAEVATALERAASREVFETAGPSGQHRPVPAECYVPISVRTQSTSVGKRHHLISICGREHDCPRCHGRRRVKF